MAMSAFKFLDLDVGVQSASDFLMDIPEPKQRPLSAFEFLDLKEEPLSASAFLDEEREKPMTGAGGGFEKEGVLYPVERGLKAMGHGLAKGTQAFWGFFDDAATLVSRATGLDKGGAFEALVEMGEPPADWQPKDLAEKIVSGLAAAGPEIGLISAIPGSAAVSMGTIGAVRGGAKGGAKEAAKEAVKGALLGGILKGAGQIPKPYHAPTVSGIFGGITAAEGGTAEEIAESAGVGMGLGVLGGGRKREKAPKLVEKAPVEPSERFDMTSAPEKFDAARIRKLLDETYKADRIKSNITELRKTKAELKKSGGKVGEVNKNIRSLKAKLYEVTGGAEGQLPTVKKAKVTKPKAPIETPTETFIGKEIFKKEERGKPEDLKPATPKQPPKMLIKMEDGTIHKGEGTHADVVNKFKLDTSKVADTGMIDRKTGKDIWGGGKKIKEQYSYEGKGFKTYQIKESTAGKGEKDNSKWRIETSEEISRSLKDDIHQLKAGKFIKRKKTVDLDGTERWTGSGSDFPEWFRNQGWGSKKAIAALEAFREGKPLGIRQTGMVEAAIKQIKESTRKDAESLAKLIEEKPKIYLEGYTDKEYNNLIRRLKDEDIETSLIEEIHRKQTGADRRKSYQDIEGALKKQGYKPKEIVEAIDRAAEQISKEDLDWYNEVKKLPAKDLKKPTIKEPTGKKSWQMSFDEFLEKHPIGRKPDMAEVDKKALHKMRVKSAISEGKITSHPDYPGLKPPPKAQATFVKPKEEGFLKPTEYTPYEKAAELEKQGVLKRPERVSKKAVIPEGYLKTVPGEQTGLFGVQKGEQHNLLDAIHAKAELLNEYRKLKGDFTSYKFNIKAPEYKRLVEVEKQLIKEGYVEPGTSKLTRTALDLIKSEKGGVSIETPHKTQRKIIKSEPRIPLKSGRGKVVKQRKLPKTKILAPAIHENEVITLVNAKRLPMTKMGRVFETSIRTYKEIKKITIEPYNAAEDTIARENIKITAGIKKLKKGVSYKNRKNIMLYAVNKQKGGAERLANQGVKEKDIPKTLTPKEDVVYEGLRNRYEEFYLRLNEARITSGKKPFPKRTDYFTFMHDLKLLDKMGLHVIEADVNIVNDAFLKLKTTPFKYAKMRAWFNPNKLVLDPFYVFESYKQSALKHIHLSPLVARLREYQLKLEHPVTGEEWRLVNENPVLAKSLHEWTNHIAGQKISKIPPVFEKMIYKVNSNLLASILGANVRSAMIQPTALRNSVAEIGPTYMSRGIKSLFIPSERSEAIAKSKVILSAQYDTTVHDALSAIRGGKIGEIKKKGAKWSLKPLQLLDMEARKATWQGGYKYASEKLKMSEPDAVLYADDLVIRTQASGLPGHIAPVQRGPVGKLFTLFQTFTINDWDFLIKDVLGKGSGGIKNKKAFKKVMTYVAATTLFNILYEDVFKITSPFPTPIRVFREALEEGKGIVSTGLDVLKELIEPIPIIGSARYGQGIGGPAAQLVSETTEHLTQQPFKKPLAEIAGKWAGVPGTAQIGKSVRAKKRGESTYGQIVGSYTPKNKRGKLVRRGGSR